MSGSAEKDVPPHECDTGHFDRTICPEPCGYMHSYCATCGTRQEPCAHDASPIPPEVGSRAWFSNRASAGYFEHADESLIPPALPLHRTEAGYPRCSTCDGGGCLDCTDPA